MAKQCFATGCPGDPVFSLTSPQAPPCFASDSCSAHLGDLLGNITKVLTGGARAGTKPEVTLVVSKEPVLRVVD